MIGFVLKIGRSNGWMFGERRGGKVVNAMRKEDR